MRLSGEIENLVSIACKSDSTVLITGQTGTGKSWLARKIHDQSARRGKPFVTANLATLHEGTIESELFGHERGAFTGADQRRIGRLEMARGGTVFLDEIGDLSPRLQARLLEFLQSKKISPVGSNVETKLDVRVIAATHKNLERAVVKGEFREDLFYRLRVIAIEMKPLSARYDELDEIIHNCLEDVCASVGRTVRKISEDVARMLETYSWPGNLRELRNVLEYAVLSATDGEIKSTDLPAWFTRGTQAGFGGTVYGAGLLGVAEVPLTLDYGSCLSQFEKEYLKRALERFRGRVNHTARKIGLNKATLIRRMRAYGLQATYGRGID